MLTYLLIAELANKRQLVTTALEYYKTIAENSQQSDLLEQATLYALEQNALNQAQQSGFKWANLALGNDKAQFIALALSLEPHLNQNHTETYYQRLLDLAPEDLIDNLLALSSQVSTFGKNKLMNSILTVAENNSSNLAAQFNAAHITANQLDLENAKHYINKVFLLKADDAATIELQAKIINHTTQDEHQALEYLNKKTKEFPKNHRIRLFYATALSDANKYQAAIPVLESLKSSPYEGDASIILGEIYIETNQLTLAKQQLINATKSSSQPDKARYYLGQIYEFNLDYPLARKWYLQVSPQSEFHTLAYLQVAAIYATQQDYTKALETLHNTQPNTFYEQKQLLITEIEYLLITKAYPEALKICNHLLTILPSDTDFLYARSTIFNETNNKIAAAQDLHDIIKINPEHANALNALGNYLTTLNKLEQAMFYLEKSLSIAPNNPIFMDSMGWLLYRMGKLQESLHILTKAYQLSQDENIAAHLVEVLSTLGNDKEADKLRKTLKKTTTHKL